MKKSVSNSVTNPFRQTSARLEPVVDVDDFMFYAVLRSSGDVSYVHFSISKGGGFLHGLYRDF